MQIAGMICRLAASSPHGSQDVLVLCQLGAFESDNSRQFLVTSYMRGESTASARMQSGRLEHSVDGSPVVMSSNHGVWLLSALHRID